MPGTLYIVSTPIGNLRDITYRAVDVLKECDIIACEDTRRTGRLLKEFGIDSRLVSYHDHNEEERAEEIVEHLNAGDSVAIVSDAGTPGIADPGYRAVKGALEAGAEIVPVPGPAAFVAAASVSGLPTDALYFGAFLPSRKGERIRRLAEVRDIPATLAFYESPHRIKESLEDCLSVLGDRNAVIARELTKVHEELIAGKISEILIFLGDGEIKGELVLLFERGSEDAPSGIDIDAVRDRYQELIAEDLDPKKALKKISKESGIPRAEVYRRIHIFDPAEEEKAPPEEDA
ncbi:MAG: 16S rRNA (cytidine(1402)-2'-O)-methyltransferase [Acidobacteria bacterium]|nr:MAG: 16S rRNA (cytidine(1402)-2'-O)-methyltransferase [Acidobacteriota bacterium]REJ98721.1 MAG: 16S rRNA (cytidine(1402)-2'-O)-methyltransferase [Acidobacteriota bacterium]REK16624.1 MAG: 16S rRNA (cytidine(1402)-2'-O)-methyltransferase [Acidobacteriota bacterium]REK42535.1 MAG: 16S rRNA (cytidine(1402)-2'-O)-methyltransferase [Acidobacteriota bacterium]